MQTTFTFEFELSTDNDGYEFATNFKEGNKNNYHKLYRDDRYTRRLWKSQPWNENGSRIQTASVTFTLRPSVLDSPAN